MPIELVPAPGAGLEIVKIHLSTTDPEPIPFLAFRTQLQNGQLVAVDEQDAPPPEPPSIELSAATPYPVYTLPLSITDGALLNARITAWQYLLVKPDRSIHALAEVAVLPDGSLSFAELYPRDYAEWLAGIINLAVDALENDGPPLQLRLLRAPSLSFHGIWLHDEGNRARDRITAIGDGEPNYRHGQVMSEETLREILGEISGRRQLQARTYQFR